MLVYLRIPWYVSIIAAYIIYSLLATTFTAMVALRAYVCIMYTAMTNDMTLYRLLNDDRSSL